VKIPYPLLTLIKLKKYLFPKSVALNQRACDKSAADTPKITVLQTCWMGIKLSNEATQPRMVEIFPSNSGFCTLQ
jgi:hypothetical protein